MISVSTDTVKTTFVNFYQLFAFKYFPNHAKYQIFSAFPIHHPHQRTPLVGGPIVGRDGIDDPLAIWRYLRIAHFFHPVDVINGNWPPGILCEYRYKKTKKTKI